MKISRWISFPLVIILSYVLPRVLFGESVNSILFWIVVGSIFGFSMLYWSDKKAREISGGIDDEKIYQVRQHRILTVLLGYNRTFELCREAVDSLNPAKIKIADLEKGVIKFRTRVNWHTWGQIITISLK